MNFRSDINGLRAVAVISVVLYHFGVPGFGGGYVGVDVFFVISGFLMTQVIVSKFIDGRFSLAGFYAARARRILPALVGLNGALLIVGGFVLLPLAYQELCKSIVSSTTFVSNIVFWRERGYFDAPSQEKWLLHSWSLSVEWQFYMVYPLGLLALQKWKTGKFLRAGMLVTLLVSLALAVLAARWKPVAAFYLLPTRSWELLAGGMVYLAKDAWRWRLGSAVGLVLIAAATFFYSTDLPFPSYWALLPVLGSALVIASRTQSLLLDNRAAQLLGNISYSLYLWHWPLVVAARRFELKLTAATILALVAAALVAAYASYRLIETPFKRIGTQARAGSYLLGSAAAAAVLATLAGVVVFTRGLPQRVSPLVAQNDAVAGQWEYPGRCVRSGDFCTLGPASEKRVLFWGDSHAEQLYPALTTILDEHADHGHQVLMGVHDSCIPIRNLDGLRGGYHCERWNQTVFERARKDDVQVVVLASIWAPYFREVLYDPKTLPTLCRPEPDACHRFADTSAALNFARSQLERDVRELRAHGKRVYLMLPVPIFDRNVSAYIASQARRHAPVELHLTRARHEELSGQITAVLRQVARATSASIIDPADVLCPQGTCIYEQHGIAIYRDNNHLAPAAARMLVPALRRVFNEPIL